MKRFLLLPAAFLLPCACISVNTAAQTLNAGTVYRNWELDDRAYVKNGFVYIKAVQCDQRKETPVIGPPMAQSDFISQMEDIPGTEKTVFLQLNKKDLPDPIEYKDLLSMVLEENFTVPPPVFPVWSASNYPSPPELEQERKRFSYRSSRKDHQRSLHRPENSGGSTELRD